MSAPTIIPSDLIVGGNLSAQSMTLAAGAVADSNVAANAKISSSKLVPLQNQTIELNGPTTTITTQTKWIKSIKGATGNLIDINAFIAVVGSGGGMSVTVDLQKSTAGGAFASVLSAVITINASTSVRTAVPGTITSAPIVAGDILQLVVVATAGGGTLPQGLTVTVRNDETYA